MSDYKMVPMVPTAEMLDAFVCGPTGTDYHGTIRLRYTAMLAKAPPFVVTDEMMWRAYRAFEAAGAETCSEWDAIRAAIEAVLGGGV